MAQKIAQNTSSFQKSSMLNFDKKPLDFLEYFNQYVIGQTQAKIALANAFCKHYNRVDREIGEGYQGFKLHDDQKANVLLIGPTGCGKTRLVRLATYFAGVPCLEVDATSLTVAGYVGNDIEEIPQLLLDEAGGVEELAEISTVWIDEVDKLAIDHARGERDIHRGGVQEGLLKLMEGSSTNNYSRALRQNVPFDTRNVLFVCTGAFEGIDEIKKERIHGNLGFSQSEQKIEDEKSDFEKYGMLKQFMARIGSIGTLNKLTEKQLLEILLLKDNSFISTPKADFENYGINIEFTDGALRRFATVAHKSDSGARALNKIINDTLDPFYLELPSTGINHLKVTAHVVDNPSIYLDKLLKSSPSVRRKTSQKKQSLGEKTILDDSQKDNFVKKLRVLGVPEEYVSVGIKFIEKTSIEIEELPYAIAAMEDQVIEYCDRFEEKYGKQLLLEESIIHTLVSLGLSSGDLDISGVLLSRFGVYLENQKKIDALNSVDMIYVDQEKFMDPAGILDFYISSQE